MKTMAYSKFNLTDEALRLITKSEASGSLSGSLNGFYITQDNKYRVEVTDDDGQRLNINVRYPSGDIRLRSRKWFLIEYKRAGK